MRVYVAASISGGRENLAAVQALVQAVEDRGHQVLNRHIASDEIDAVEAAFTPEQIFRRDVDWIDASDLLLAEVTVPSTGVGFEIGRALQRGIPVVCLCRKNVRLSAMIAGNDADNMKLIRYSDIDELRKAVNQHL